VAGAGNPALATTTWGETAEHWGAYAIGGAPFDTQLSPAMLALPAPVAEIGTNNSTQYALLTDGTVWAWGTGGDGQLGDGETANSFSTAVQVRFPGGVKIASIATDVSPFSSALAIDTTGHAWGWGRNQGGEFCLHNKKEYLTPVELPFSHVTTLAGAANHATYDAGGTLYSCGQNEHGALGDGTTVSSTTPVKVAGLNGADVTTLVAAWANTGAVLANGDYYDWGYNRGGQVGNGTTAQVNSPYRVPLPAGVTQASQGGSFPTNGQTIVLLSSGALYAWGSDGSYQLGNGTQGNKTVPVKITPPSGVTYTAVACGGSTCYGIAQSGAVYAWGQNNYGQVGDGSTTTAKHPVEVTTGAAGISATAHDVAVLMG
jgi:alpha-tubulin suppressor-like RCC1 family protein